jgi:hypothetical protein
VTRVTQESLEEEALSCPLERTNSMKYLREYGSLV